MNNLISWQMRLFVSVFLSLASSLLAQTSIDVGDYGLLPNTPNQVIEIMSTGNDQVRGFNLRAQLGDGSGPLVEPSFTSVSFDGGIWSEPSTVLGETLGSFAQIGVALTDADETVVSNGVIAKLAISTEGISEGVFELRLKETEIGADSDFVLTGGDSLTPSIANGILRIVPEPQGTPWIAMAMVYLMVRTRRSQGT